MPVPRTALLIPSFPTISSFSSLCLLPRACCSLTCSPSSSSSNPLSHASPSSHASFYILTAHLHTSLFPSLKHPPFRRCSSLCSSPTYAPPVHCTTCTHVHDAHWYPVHQPLTGWRGAQCLRGRLLLAGGWGCFANPHRGSRFSGRCGVDARRNFQMAWLVISDQ